MPAHRSVPFNVTFIAAAIFFSTPLSAQTIILRDIPACPDGQPDASWSDCRGSNTSPDGGKYVGTYLNGKPSGDGIFTRPNA